MSTLLATSMTLYIILTYNTYKDEIKRLCQRYADRMEEHSNILATNLVEEVKATRRLKRKSQDSCI